MIELSLDDLAHHCAEETRKFNHRQASDPQYCFELLRRALADGVTEAFTHFYQIYERQVLSWVHQHHSFERAGESAEFFANVSFQHFYFALRGAKFARFSSLPRVLAYLKLCVHTAVTAYIRDFERLSLLPLDAAHDRLSAPDPVVELQAAEIWNYICLLLPDEHDRLLARYTFILNLKPSQIVASYPEHWQTERDVSVALYRIRQRLRGDAGLRERLGLTNGHDE